MKITHGTFAIERTFDAPRDRVFAALADPEKKARWFVGPPGWKLIERAHDFRVGGREKVSGKFENGMTSSFDAEYFDIVANERIVYAYEMTVNGRKISVSLATFELAAEGSKTKMVLTEQGAFFEDPDAKDTYAPQGQLASREEGTRGLLDRLASSLV